MRQSRQGCCKQDSQIVNKHSLVIRTRTRVVWRFESVTVISTEMYLRRLLFRCEKRIVEFFHLLVENILDLAQNILDAVFQDFNCSCLCRLQFGLRQISLVLSPESGNLSFDLRVPIQKFP